MEHKKKIIEVDEYTACDGKIFSTEVGCLKHEQELKEKAEKEQKLLTYESRIEELKFESFEWGYTYDMILSLFNFDHGIVCGITATEDLSGEELLDLLFFKFKHSDKNDRYQAYIINEGDFENEDVLSNNYFKSYKFEAGKKYVMVHICDETGDYSQNYTYILSIFEAEELKQFLLTQIDRFFK